MGKYTKVVEQDMNMFGNLIHQARGNMALNKFAVKCGFTSRVFAGYVRGEKTRHRTEYSLHFIIDPVVENAVPESGVTDRMSVGNVQRIIKKYAALVSEKGVSLPDSVHCHMFRRTRATNLYQDGIAIELVSTVLGHARTDTTKSYYAKPSVEQLRDAMESVPTPVSDEAPMWEGNEDEMARLCGLR